MPNISTISDYPQQAPANKSNLKEYLDTREAAEFLGVSTNFLEGARCSRSGPPYYKLMRRVGIYAKIYIVGWLNAVTTKTNQQEQSQ